MFMRSVRSYLIEKLLMVSKHTVKPNNMLREKYIQNRHAYVLAPHIKKKYGITKMADTSMDIYSLMSKSDNPTKVVLFLHGGAYVDQPLSWHWRFLHKLTKKLSCRIIVPIYPKTPNNHCLEVIDPIVDLYASLLLKHDAKDIIIMGDSAGGGLALALAQTLKHQKISQPGQIVLLSPWLDIELNDPAIQNYRNLDPVLDLDLLIAYGKIYAFDLDTKDYRVSPINGNLEELAPISLFVGTHEIFLPDARRFKRMMDDQHLPLMYFEFDKMNHDFVLFPIPEAQKALTLITKIIQ